MRLTLRTLLAYIDNTLDPQDAEILKSKVAESGFATQMVQRIRSLLLQSDLPAPSPLARGPVEEANVICEYLDSTLPVEQVAEVERACLDSDPHLAEAAACHQILTMVLENPASVPVVLRDRIYQLPGEQKGSQNTAGSFSALVIPDPVNSFDAPSSQVLSSEVPPPPPHEPVRPVGVGDSGVMAAPARLRERELADDQAAKAGPAIAGSRPVNRNVDSSMYGGQVRPSRITPWLVTLGLAAVLLYALAQIFQPLLDANKTAGIDDENAASNPSEVRSLGTVGDGTDGDVEVTESGQSSGANTNSKAAKSDRGISDPKNSGSGGSEIEKESVEAPVAGQPAPSNDETTEVGAGSEVDGAKPEMSQGDADTDDALQAEKDAASGNALPPVVTPPEPKPPVTDNPASGEMEQEASAENVSPSPVLAKVISENTFLAIENEGQWQRLGKDAEVAVQQPLVVAPGFRATLAIPDAEVTLLGPASAMLLSNDKGSLTVRLASGRLLVSAAKPESSVEVQLGDEKWSLELATPDTTAAIQLTQTRELGLDPLLPKNHVDVRRLIAVQGTVNVEMGGGVASLEPNSQWTQVGASEPSVEFLDGAPAWTTEAVDASDPLAATARSNLLDLLDGAPSLEIALRELLGFRRSEVADLAARTLLALGRSDVYFGGAGVFNDPKQRAYWSKHYDAVLARVDNGSESAAEVQQAIKKMDAAAEVQLFRMLTGYTDEQLASGSDLQLLDNLDSADMSVRVLAFENLRRITGVTFNYRAEQDSQGRREQYLKKWQVRQRKGEIRWKD